MRMVARDPLDGLVKRSGLGLSELFERNSLVDHAGRRVRGEFLGNEKHGIYIRRRLLGLINVPHKERICNLIHGAKY